jgi:type VI protein secretion system component VasK
MALDWILAWCMYALYLPLLSILLILGHYLLRRFLWKRGICSGFCPSACALGMAFQQMQVLTRPSIAHVLAEKQKQEADEDGDGDPESPEARLLHFHRQLRRIRRGDPVERLVLRI